MSLNVSLKRIDKTYLTGEKVSGYVIVDTKKPMSHSGIKIFVEGGVSISTMVNTKNADAWESMQHTTKPIKFIEFNMDILAPGKLPDGRTELPFEFLLKATSASLPLYETYHGQYLSVRYKIHVEMSRGFLSRDMKKTVEFYVQCPSQGYPPSGELDPKTQLPVPKPITFSMTPQKLKNVRKAMIDFVPDYLVEGRFDSFESDIGQPLTGEVIIKSSETDIKSVELQLVRVESCVVADGSIKEATEVQNLHLGEGNICKNFALPIYMTLPRRFTCPTLLTKIFRVEFEANVIILFVDGHQITENCKLHLYRPPTNSVTY